MAPITTEMLLERSKIHASEHRPQPFVSEMGSDGTHLVIVSCADPRVIPEQIFQLSTCEAIVMRNIAGHPQEALNGILALDTFLGVNEIIVLHHTDCGSTFFTDEGVRRVLKERRPDISSIAEMEFGAVSDSIEQSLSKDLKFLRNAPLLRPELAAKCRGFMYDIKTGKLSEVDD